MKKLFYLLLALPLVFAACTEQPEDTLTQKEYAFVLESAKVMNFAIEGGEGLIEWSLNEVTRNSPVPEPLPTFVTEAEWITLSAENLGAFTVAANEGEAREAIIRIEFLDQIEEVTVKQDGIINFEAAIFECDFEEGSGDAPANFFVVLSDNGISESSDVKANSRYYCIDLYAHNYDDMSDGYVTLPVGEYTFDTLNTFAAGTFTQMYSYFIQAGDTENDVDTYYYSEASLVVNNEGITLRAIIDGKEHVVTYTGSLDIPVEYVPEEPATELGYAMANYMGDYYNPGVADNFTLILSDLGWDEEGWELPNAGYYVFDLYTEVTNGVLEIPYGTYSLDLSDSCAPNTIGASYSKFIRLDEYGWDYVEEVYFASATLTVTESGITADLVAEDGREFKVAYNGIVANIVDCSGEFGGGDEILSTLWEDWYCNFSDCSMDYTWYGDYYGVGYDNWLFYLMPNGEVGDGLQLDLLSNTVGSYELSGEYIISNSQEKFTAYPGYENGGYMEGCWYFSADYTQYAPLVEGDISITNNDGTFTVELDAYDDAGNNITGTWTGVDPNQASTFGAAAKSAHHGLKNKAFKSVTKRVR